MKKLFMVPAFALILSGTAFSVLAAGNSLAFASMHHNQPNMATMNMPMSNCLAKATTVSESFKDMNAHEKAAVIHENLNSGHSQTHQLMATDHLDSINS